MAYAQFTTLGQAKAAFGLRTCEGDRFLPELAAIPPSQYLQEFLQESLPVAVATGSEKARSELIISPLLLEVRRILRQDFGQAVSLFSGEEFVVDEAVGLSGDCDFLISRSPEQMEIEAPAVVIVEAKKADLKSGLGKCVAEMVAAQRFNQAHSVVNSAGDSAAIATIYGCLTNGNQWRFLKLVDQTVTIDLNDYALPPVGDRPAELVWMVRNA